MPSRRCDQKVVLWDFHGTLAEDPGGWPGTLVGILDSHLPGHGIQPDALEPFLLDGFPWHCPEIPHPELSDAHLWWENLNPVFSRALCSVGVPDAWARELAQMVREVYTQPARYKLYPDVLEALNLLRKAGWHHVIVSNHVPELADIVKGIGLSGYFQAIINSAITGYEKPHHRAFEAALLAGKNPSRVWMIGDNPIADVLGAERAGIPAILVRGDNPGCLHAAPDALVAADIIQQS